MTFLSSLTLTAYRSYAHATLAAAPGLIVLTGANGAGKTNILEAISLLAPGRGLRRAKLAEVQKFGSEQPWAIHSTLIKKQPHSSDMKVYPRADGDRNPQLQETVTDKWILPGENRDHAGMRPEDTMTIATGRDPNAPESDRRIVLIDGNKMGQPELNEHLAISWLTPTMDRLWTDSPGTRRRFLDRLTAALDPAHTTRLNRYEAALAERNRLLKDGRADDRWLDSIEHTLATEGVAVMAARRELVLGLCAGLAQNTGAETTHFPRPRLSLEGVENWLSDTPALLVEDRLRDELARARRIDGAAGITTLGPHRSDLGAIHPEKDMPAGLCSTGEQKALLISLVLAHARLISAQRHQTPLLLLDEIGAHLDENRRDSLYTALFSLGAQVWMTGADSALFSPLSGRVLCYEIGAGGVVKNAPL